MKMSLHTLMAIILVVVILALSFGIISSIWSDSEEQTSEAGSQTNDQFECFFQGEDSGDCETSSYHSEREPVEV